MLKHGFLPNTNLFAGSDFSGKDFCIVKENILFLSLAGKIFWGKRQLLP